MRVFKYWAKKQVKQTSSHPMLGVVEEREFTYYGGSNLSEEDAIRDAGRRIANIKQYINGIKDWNHDYIVDIREKWIHSLDNNNVITQNRYGAFVLNSANLLMIDVDQYMLSYKIGILKSLWYKYKNGWNVDIQHCFLKEKASLLVNQGLFVKVYKTYAGYRVIVIGKEFNPRSKEVQSLMKSFYADSLYKKMCYQQNCFRSRLSPKPERIDLNRVYVKYPYTSEKQKNKREQWTNIYKEKSENYAICRLLFTEGHSIYNPVVDYHDELCKTEKHHLPLA